VTVFDLFFILLVLICFVTLVAAGVRAIQDGPRQAWRTLRNLLLCAMCYIGIVYAATAVSHLRVHRVGDPQCNDDWCLSIDDVQRTAKDSYADVDVTLRVFSRAARRAQRELIATDVYLVDGAWNRYDPILDGSEIPLNTLLQPRQSVTTRRRFRVPEHAHLLGLRLGHRDLLPVCLIIGECEAFHKGEILRLD
jgi:hypothetical protein